MLLNTALRTLDRDGEPRSDQTPTPDAKRSPTAPSMRYQLAGHLGSALDFNRHRHPRKLALAKLQTGA